MNLIEIYVKVFPTNWMEKEKIVVKTYKQEILKETEKQIKFSKNFGHDFSSIIYKNILNQIQTECTELISVNQISRWIYVREDENYNEESLKQSVINSVLEEINNRRESLKQMEELLNELRW